MIDFTVLIPVYNTNPIDLIECVYSVHWTNQTIKQEYDIVLVDVKMWIYGNECIKLGIR